MNHKHRWGWGDGRCTELGPTACIRPTVHGGSPDITNPDGTMAGGETQHLAGFILSFDVDWNDGYRIEGGINVDPHFPDRPIWTMTGSLETGDLTLDPSILMDWPPHTSIHGYIRQGRWVE